VQRKAFASLIPGTSVLAYHPRQHGLISVTNIILFGASYVSETRCTSRYYV
jgi:hypothetical protein